jgi:hypothetical protein
MEIHTLGYDSKRRWSANSRPEMDSDRTLILLFGSSGFVDCPDPIDELLTHYRQSLVIGCSTAGEILGTQIVDESVSAAIVRFDQTDLRMASAPVQSVDDSFAAGQAIARQLNDARLSCDRHNQTMTLTTLREAV